MNITVFGSARLAESTSEYQDAMRLGRILGTAGHTITTGGYGGLMEAVSRGAQEAGGRVIGITMAPWKDRLTPNPYLSTEQAQQTLFARIEALIKADCLIALAGGAGTLGEVALAWNLLQMNLIPATPVILVGAVWRDMCAAFRAHLIVNAQDMALLTLVDTVDEAVEALQRVPAASVAPWKG